LHECAICRHFGLEPRRTSSVVGLATAIRELIQCAFEPISIDGDGSPHVMLPACPEHVVAIYREHIPGVRMAWRMPVGPLLPTKG
jgi:hypothetical protein